MKTVCTRLLPALLLLAGCAADSATSSDLSGGDDRGDSTYAPPPGSSTGTGGGSGGSSYPGQGAAGSTSVMGGGGSGSQPPPGQGGQAGQQGEAGEAGQGGQAGEAGAPQCLTFDPDKPTTLYLSSDDSNSMASAALARGLLRQGQTPPSWLIRSYEFLNYYNVAFAPPTEGAVRLVPQMRPVASSPGDYALQIGVQAAPRARRPMNITLVLDTSGSMSGKPLVLQRAALHALAGQLREGDIVSMSTWNTQTNVVLDSLVVHGPSDPTLLAAVDQLAAGGGTDLYNGLVNGYDLARKNYSEDRTNRVVVISDGIANVGITEETFIGQEADVENKEGIYLVGVGVGDGVNDTLLNVVTDAGNGAYVYLDSEAEAERMLGDRFDETMEIAARNVQVSVTMPSYFSIVKFSGEQYSTDPAKVKPQHLAPGDAMVISQTIRACDPTIVRPEDALTFKATWTEPSSYQPRSVDIATTVGALQQQGDAELRRGLAIVAYADALKKGSSCSARPALVAEAVAALDAADPASSDPSLNEIRELVGLFGQMCP